MKVFINKPLPEAGMELLRNAPIDLIIPERSDLTYDEWVGYCQQADALLNVGKNLYDATFFETCPNVKAISLFSVGYDKVDIAEATNRKIPIGNTPNVLSKATSDIAFLLMQAVSRRASFYINQVNNGEWNNHFDAMAYLGQELYGKTVGVFGMGRIGYEFAKKCKYAFDMNIIYHNRSKNAMAEQMLDATYVSFDELLSQSDVLSIHANYDSSNHHLFNDVVFHAMKPNAMLINTARGGFINEEHLYQALRNGVIWGAGLDVTDPEPMNPNSNLLSLSTVCVLPHIGSATVEARNGMAIIAAENIIAFCKGEKMPHIVNSEVYDL